ncbi:hypothetical protein J6590_093900 [Homalodisca vitripennis]|nr:hypothetical protein J6590_093900 [Homalodisca vitripennis]
MPEKPVYSHCPSSGSFFLSKNRRKAQKPNNEARQEMMDVRQQLKHCTSARCRGWQGPVGSSGALLGINITTDESYKCCGRVQSIKRNFDIGFPVLTRLRVRATGAGQSSIQVQVLGTVQSIKRIIVTGFPVLLRVREVQSIKRNIDIGFPVLTRLVQSSKRIIVTGCPALNLSQSLFTQFADWPSLR